MEDNFSSESSEEETEAEDECETNSRGSIDTTVVVASTNHQRWDLRSEELPARYDASGKLVLTSTGRNNAAASPLRDLEKKIAEAFKPRELTAEEEIEVQAYVLDWQDFNNATAADSLELFDLCLESEDLIYEALGKLNVHQQLVFTASLSELGYEVQSRYSHYDLARFFGGRLPVEYLCANISPEFRREAEAAADFPPEILREQFEKFFDFDPYGREWDARIKALQDHCKSRQYQKAINPSENHLESSQTESHSLSKEIRPTDHRPLPTPPSIGLSSISEDLPNNESKPADILDPAYQQDRDLLSPTPSPTQSFSPQSDSAQDDSDPFQTPEAAEVLLSLAEGSQLQPVASESLSKSQEFYTDAGKVPRNFWDSRDKPSDESKSASSEGSLSRYQVSPSSKMGISTEVALPLPVLPEGWAAEKDFKVVASLSPATQRSIEPVGPHFLAHARRARHKRTFSEDDRIQAQESVKKVEDEDAGDISEPEDPAMLLRDAKDWKVWFVLLFI